MWVRRQSLLFIFLFLCADSALISQTAQESHVLFSGTWKATCGDGKDFVILTLAQKDSSLAGTISLGNTRGPEGQCDTVVNPPDDQHRIDISNVKAHNDTVSFTAKHMDFEMTITDADHAKLKFLGTPVEQEPWKLHRTER